MSSPSPRLCFVNGVAARLGVRVGGVRLVSSRLSVSGPGSETCGVRLFLSSVDICWSRAQVLVDHEHDAHLAGERTCTLREPVSFIGIRGLDEGLQCVELSLGLLCRAVGLSVAESRCEGPLNGLD